MLIIRSLQTLVKCILTNKHAYSHYDYHEPQLWVHNRDHEKIMRNPNRAFTKSVATPSIATVSEGYTATCQATTRAMHDDIFTLLWLPTMWAQKTKQTR